MRPVFVAALLAIASTSAVGMTAEELAELNARMDASMAKVAGAAEANRQEVRTFAHEACKRLWADDADEAILNPVCYEIFSGFGLPN